MPVDTLTEFPASIVSGDTVRVTISDPDHPATGWSLKVLFSGGAGNRSFDATKEGSAFALVLTPAQSATLAAGQYAISYIYTETDSGDRETDNTRRVVIVFPNPASTSSESIARQTLTALEASLLLLADNPEQTVNFNGQSFTSRNLDELQRAIVKQKQIVAFDENRARTDAGLPSNRFSKLRF